MKRPFFWLFIGTALSGCYAHPARFSSAPPVRQIKDNALIQRPKVHRLHDAVELPDVYLRRPLVNQLRATAIARALDRNAYDELPSSSWFQPRPLDLDIFHQLTTVKGRPQGDLKILSVSLRHREMVLEDARQVRYILLVDPNQFPHSWSAAGIIAPRLAQAVGYHARETHLWRFDANRFAEPDLKRNAEIFLRRFDGKPVLATAYPGYDLGPTHMSTRRPGDKNDWFSPIDRRSLRALPLLALWLGLRSVGPKHTRDYFIGTPRNGYLRHYIDRLEHSLSLRSPRFVRERVDAVGDVSGNLLKNLWTLGLASRPPSVPGAYDDRLKGFSPRLNPTSYRMGRPYEPADFLRAEDAYWITKRMMRIPRGLIDHFIQESGITDHALRDQLAQTLEARRASLARHWFARGSPMEFVSLGEHLVLADNALVWSLANDYSTRYQVSFLDAEGVRLRPDTQLFPKHDSVTIPMPNAPGDYLIVRIQSQRGNHSPPPPAEFHFRLIHRTLKLVGIQH